MEVEAAEPCDDDAPTPTPAVDAGDEACGDAGDEPCGDAQGEAPLDAGDAPDDTLTTTLDAGDNILATLVLGPERDDEGLGCRVVDLRARDHLARALEEKEEWRELAAAPAAVDKLGKASAKEHELRRLIAKLTFSLQEKDMQLDAQRQTNRALSDALAKHDAKAGASRGGARRRTPPARPRTRRGGRSTIRVSRLFLLQGAAGFARLRPSPALRFGRRMSAFTEGVCDGDPHASLETVLDADNLNKEKIPGAYEIGEPGEGRLYNFWQDDEHFGDTAATWVWHGSSLLDDGNHDRALISLSPGGSDADTTREFDLTTNAFVDAKDGGFAMPTPAKTQIAYRGRDECLVGTDFGGDGSALTDSGYPRVVKSWKRGTPLDDAVTVFEGEKQDIAASQYCYKDRGVLHEFRVRSLTFYTSKHWYRSPKAGALAHEDATPFAEVPIPADANIGTFGACALVTLRSDWTAGCETYAQGSLLSVDLEALVAGDLSNVTALFTPTEARSLEDTTETRDFLVLKVLEDVRTKLVTYRYAAGAWSLHDDGSGGAVGVGEDVAVQAVNRRADADNKVYVWRDGYLVPYFVMRREDLAFDGSNPTLVDAYGGFEISLTPGYSAGVGVGWLERGGVKVIANIRGGGEYARWHQAALKAKRFKAYEDLEAVAQDVVDRGISSPPKLAVIGGSNGGLMVGNAITRPRASALFGAAVCQVPLLDMKRYSHLLAGASWMAEYGDPDTDDWAFLRDHSPYQKLRHDRLGIPEDGEGAAAPDADWTCPRVLFTTSTRDDRNTEGGHGGAADNKQRAFMWALTYNFLADVLGLE
ncbi:serine-type exopeptidase [Aureococcus anophagefferens]|nr:serine-type exopeptidase [Aureococcus anophagefferens]